MLSKLGLKELQAPQLKVDFHSSGSKYLPEKGIIVIDSTSIYRDARELVRIIDHEIAHHIQHIKNPWIRKPLPLWKLELGVLRWVITGKMSKALVFEAFREGFAVYVAFITSGVLNQKLQKEIDDIRKRKMWKIALKIIFSLLSYTEVIPYALGYIFYQRIAKVKSEKEAISLGLYGKPDQLLLYS